MKAKIVFSLLTGILIGIFISANTVSAQSNSSDATRIVRALEDISETLKRIEKKVK